MAQIHCKDLSLGYEGTTVLESLDLEIFPGEYLCILGENGAGKSTLMRVILGLHPLTHGTITLGDGLTVKDIGYLTQQSSIQRDFPASVGEIVRSGHQNRSTWRPYYSKEEKIQTTTVLEQMGIAHLSKRCYGALSGGQQQRVLLARALCATRKILFLDEPVTGLDPEVSRDFYQIIRRLHDQEGITIVMISHDVDTALEEATRVLHLGQERFCGDKPQYLQWLSGQKRGQAHG